MMTKALMTVGLLAMIAMAAGCAGPTRLEMDYGTSYRLALFNQILNPEAEKNLEPVTGLNGRAAQGAMDRYFKGFEEKPAAPVYSINIGSLGQ